MTQFGTTDSANHLNRILPVPQFPSYLGRHPIYPKPSPEITTRIYNPVYQTYWQKSPDNYAEKSRDYHCATYTYIGPEWFKAPPKEYATYKDPLPQSGGISNNYRPQTVPKKTSQSGDDYSQFLNDYPGRFKIEYASPDDVNGLCFKNNHVQYDSSVTHRPDRYAYQTDKEPFTLATGIPNRMEPVTNPFRQSDAQHAPMTTNASWYPYGNIPTRYQNFTSQNPRF